MSEAFGPDFITITDEDGNDIELEYMDAMEHNGEKCMVFLPTLAADANEEDEKYGLIILKEIVENGEEMLSTLDSDEELQEMYDLFMERLFQDEEDGEE